MPRDFANTHSQQIDQDTLMSLSKDTVVVRASALLDPIQNERGEEILAGTAVAFYLMCERYSASPQDLYEYGRRVVASPNPHHKKGNDLLESLRDFLAQRVRKDSII